MVTRSISCFLIVVLTGAGCDKYNPVELSGTEQVEKAAGAYRVYEPPPRRIPKDGPPVITAAEFQSIEVGMNFEQVTAKVGDPGKLESKEVNGAQGAMVETYLWENPDLTSATLVFVNTRLVEKEATGLK
ncbi:MAG: hypothetical protein AAB353_00760 [Candidatus Hydrogenedentota bacterium]